MAGKERSTVFSQAGLSPGQCASLEATVTFLATVQEASGAIPWFEDGALDPWNHVEAAMGLSIGGRCDEALQAYRWLACNQRADGSWWASYQGGRPQPPWHCESNQVAYVATGVWHHYLISKDCSFLEEMWPMVNQALRWVLELQSEHGDILWARDHQGKAYDDSLITGCSSIYKSLECGLRIAGQLGHERPAWRQAQQRLANALHRQPRRFNRGWETKLHAMDWFYPVLGGVFEGAAGHQHLMARWDEFVELGLGCRCVADEPWVTVAESCELGMALLAVGEAAMARRLLDWQWPWQSAGGGFWTGYQLHYQLLWPVEQPTWTAAAVLLLADALHGISPASRLFTRAIMAEAP